MTSVKLYYLSGDTLRLDKCETVGSIMAQVAKMHQRFAPDVAVVCLDSGKDLTRPHSQVPPPAASVVLKQAVNPPTEDDLRLTLFLHAECEDTATCVRALGMIRQSCVSDILQTVLDDKAEGQLKMLRTLLRAGAGGAAVLRKAYDRRDREAMEALFAAGVRPGGKYGNYHRGLLTWGSMRGYKYMIQLLLSDGTHVDDADVHGRTGLIWASMCGRADVVETLLAHSAHVDRADEDGRTGLMWASMRGYRDVVETLLLNRAQVNRADLSGRTALMMASARGYKNVVEILLLNSAQVDYAELYGHTALMIASARGYKNVVEALLSYGAQVHHADACGRAALTLASAHGFTGLVEILRTYGA